MTEFLLKVYKDIASRYELTNRILTFGLDNYWRRKTVDIAVQGRSGIWLDACTGTGELAIALKAKAPRGTVIYATDFSAEMLKVAGSKQQAAGIIFKEANTFALPFEDNYFDLITISFALRNLKTGSNKFVNIFKEIHRVLKPGGRFVNIETSQPKLPIIKWIFRSYVKYFTAFIGGIFTRSFGGFNYLSSSVLNFNTAEDLVKILKEGGFSTASYTPLLFGAIAIHKAEK